MKRVTLEVKDELHRAAMVKAAQTGVSVSATVREFLRQWTTGKIEIRPPKRV